MNNISDSHFGPRIIWFTFVEEKRLRPNIQDLKIEDLGEVGKDNRLIWGL